MEAHLSQNPEAFATRAETLLPGAGETPQPEGLSLEQKKALARQLLSRKMERSAKRIPVSYGQQALWVTCRNATNPSAYNEGFAARIVSDFSLPLLKKVFQRLVNKHAALRTRYGLEDEAVYQEVAGYQEVDFRVTDATAWSDAELRVRVKEAFDEPFDLAQGQVFRVVLFTTPRGSVLLVALHHIACDGWSMNLLLHDIRVLYTAEVTGTLPGPEPVRHEYEPFVAYQRQLLDGPEGDRLRGYWAEKLGGGLPLLDLPADKVRSPFRSEKGAHRYTRINPALTRELKALSRAEGVTLFTTLMAAYTVLLHRYTGQDDLVVGTPAANRVEPRFEQTVGYFVNPVAIRSTLAATDSFRAHLHKIHRAITEAVAHQEYPYAALVEKLGLGHPQNHSPVFQTLFYLQGSRQYASVTELLMPGNEGYTVDLGSLTLEYFALPAKEGRFDLSVEFIEGGQELAGLFTYSTDLFNEDTIGRLAGCYEQLLAGIVAAPGAPAARLDLLTDPGRAALLAGFAGKSAPHPPEETFARRFEAQAARTPAATALVCNATAYTYLELNARANQLAHCLREQFAVRPEDIVGLMLERSEWLVIGLLGILKSGAAYLPLDPQLPVERLEYMLSETGAKVVVTAGEVPRLSTTAALSLTDGAEISRHPATDPVAVGGAASLAYLIYTSGSTGRPKGVMIEQRGMLNHLCAKIEDLHLDAGSAVVQNAAISFDISVWQALAALLVGGCTHVYPQALVLQPRDFLLSLARHRISVLEVVPAYLGELLDLVRDEGLETAFASLEYLVVTGETLRKPLAARWFAAFPGIPLVNAYGPTEASDDVTHCIMRALPDGESIPIGSAVRNTHIYIVDERMQLLPVGVKGEICVAGAGVGRGYYNDASRTAAVFGPDPFRPGQRLYRTGDVGRYLPDGNIEFFGRRDLQVKVKGYRIELEEIEQLLTWHPAVQQGAVVVCEDAGLGNYLFAFVTANAGTAVREAELKQFLAERLPAYMIPAGIVTLPEMPLTPNGKTDRKALATRSRAGAAGGAQPHAAPRTGTEKELQAAWERVLQKGPVGVTDHFFETGGNSLKAVKIQAFIVQRFGIPVSFRDFFTYPTIRQMAGYLQQQLPGDENGIRPVTPAPHYALSPAQRRLWTLDQFEAHRTAYTIFGAYRLAGPIDPERLGRVFGGLVARHESLRTAFVLVGQEPRQVIRTPGETFRLDYRTLAKDNLAEALAAEADRPFDLSAAPLMRVGLWGVAPNEHVLTFSVHHIIADAWSLEVLVGELVRGYDCLRRGEPLALAPLPVQFKDYLAWQTARDTSQHRAYWLDRLAGPLPVLALPADFARPAVRSLAGASRYADLPPRLVEGVERVARDGQVTVFMVLLATVKAFLFRLTGEEDLIAGTTIANRDRPELLDQFGFYISLVPLRTQLRGTDSFSQLLDRVRETVLGAFEHQEYPFDEMAENLPAERDPGRNPFFDVLVDWIGDEIDAGQVIRFDDVALTRLPVARDTSKFDLSFRFLKNPGGIQLHVEYSTALFSAGRVARMVAGYETLLDAVVADVHQPLAQLEYIPSPEKKQLLAMSAGPVVPSEAVSLQALFERQAARTPDAVAVVYEGAALSYGELNRRANQLAHYLRATFGLAPNDLVGILADRSDALVTGILAVLKTGAAFLPLDPSGPAERTGFMLADAKARLLMTDSAWLMDPRFTYEGDVYALDLPPGDLATCRPENPVAATRPGDLAYVIYTSGSTGTPKGVEVTAANISGYIQWANQYYFNDRAGFPFAFFTSLAFDLTLTSLFSSLTRGDALHVYGESAGIHHTLLAVFGPQSPVRAVKLTPSHVKVLQYLPLGPSPVTCVIVGGEDLTPEHSRILFGLNAAMRVHNEYGPTEATVGCSVATLEDASGKITIGRPVANARLYVLDPGGNVTPVGVTGEIFIGGPGVAKGYRYQPDLTAARFVPDPFAPDAGCLYRTGDLGRWEPSGELVYLGRADHQVKVRGHRVEPAEIEKELNGLDLVREGIVLAAETDGSPELVGYVVPAGETTPAQVAARLAARLPAYMVPGRWVMLTQMPLNGNGKTDRARLAEMPATGLTTGYAAPRTPREAQLLAIWQEVLGGENIGIHDNFFTRGGHSLKAIQVLMTIQQRLGVSLELEVMFECPTVEALSRRMDRETTPEGDGQVILPAPPQADYDLSYAQRRLWFIDQLEEQPAAYNIAGAKVLKGRLDEAAFGAAFAALVARHESLRTVFVPVDGQPRQRILTPGEAGGAVACHDLRQVPDNEAVARETARREAATPFDLAAGPLLRATLLRLGDETYAFIFVIHHIIADGWSMEIIIREWMSLYTACTRGLPDPLAPLAVQYKDFAHWQHRRLDEAAMRAHQQYWRQQLDGEIPVLQLPADFERPRVRQFRSASLDFRLDEPATQRLHALGRQQEVSPFVVLMGAVLVLLHRYSGQDDLIVGTPVAGRDRFELQNQVGFYLNTLPVRLAVDHQDHFAGLLAKVQRVLVGAYAHQDYPFDRLVDDLRPNRDPGRSPLFDVLVVSEDFALSGPEAASRFAGLTTENLPVDLAAGKFDLTFYFRADGSGTHVNLAYDTSLFGPERMERMVQHFRNLLGGLLADPRASVCAAGYLTPAERKKWVADFNDTVVPYAVHKTMHQLFEERAALHPSLPALRQHGREMSYGELNGKANVLARRLRGAGVRTGDHVGVRSNRNFEMITGLLAVLKAGAAYVPIDPAYPQDRQLYMLANARARVLLTDAGGADDLAALPPDVRRVDIAGPGPGDPGAEGNLDVPVTGQDMAYTIYTSGSTGRPKGVMIKHHSAVNLITWVNRTFNVGAADRMLLVTSMCFDLSVYDIFGILAAGGAVVIAGPADIEEVDALKALLVTERITFWDSVPTTLNYLVTELEHSRQPYGQTALRLVFMSGDWIPVGLPARLQKFFPGAAVVSLGGATEGTVWSNFYPIHAVRPGWTSIPYGRPIDNNFFYVLDPLGNPVPQGVTGELYIGGVGVSEGYQNEPGKTGAAFLADPFLPHAGGRMYRTGDLGRIMADGNMEFLGRRDQQVKIRGFRVELGEIEAALTGHEAIEAALVATCGNGPAGRQLVAYYIAGREVSTGALTGFLGSRLPGYMIPAHFVRLDRFPLNANGKIDRKALPEPTREAVPAEAASAPPATPLEEALAGIWRQVLGLETVGVLDDFFAVGGHSLAASQVMARVREETGVAVKLRMLFLTPTIRDLAQQIETLRWASAQLARQTSDENANEVEI